MPKQHRSAQRNHAEGQHHEVAEANYGEYPRGPYWKYEGGIVAYRRSFSSAARLMRSVIEIEWVEEEGLSFIEHSQFQAGSKRIDNSQKGHVHISQTTGLIHLVTCRAAYHPNQDVRRR